MSSRTNTVRHDWRFSRWVVDFDGDDCPVYCCARCARRTSDRWLDDLLARWFKRFRCSQ